MKYHKTLYNWVSCLYLWCEIKKNIRMQDIFFCTNERKSSANVCTYRSLMMLTDKAPAMSNTPDTIIMSL